MISLSGHTWHKLPLPGVFMLWHSGKTTQRRRLNHLLNVIKFGIMWEKTSKKKIQKSISALGLSSKCACFPFHSEQEIISLNICSWEVLQKHKMNSEDLVLCLQRQQRTVQTKMSAEEIRRRWLPKDENIFKEDLTKLKLFSICFVSRRTQHKNQQTLRNLHCFLKKIMTLFWGKCS